MADLIVNASLDDTNSDLKAILDEFNNCQKNAQENQNIWGAMNSFASNWRVHRGQIQSTLTTLSNNVDKACSTWSDADKQLADSVAVSNS
jgi:flagellar biosynthesis chaperone FliJ